MKKIGIGTLNFTKKKYNYLFNNFKFINKKIFIDTSPNYGNFFAEKALGTIINKKNRHKYFIASKFGLEFDKKKKTFSKKAKLSEKYIISSLNKTLNSLKTNYLDLFQIHCFNEDIDLVVKTLINLKKEKKILNIGCVNFNYEQIQKYEKKLNNHFFDYVQIHYNFFERKAEKKIIPYCIKFNKKIIANRIFGSGIFIRRNSFEDKRFFYSKRLANKLKLMREKVEFFLKSLDQLNIDERHFLISWIKNLKYVNVLLFGVSKKNDMKFINNFYKTKLNHTKLTKIDKLMKKKFNLYNNPKSFHE